MKKWVYMVLVLLMGGVLTVRCQEDDSMWDWMVPETEDEVTQAEIEGFVYKPGLAPASEENIGQLELPDGFTVQKFAEDVGKPRMMTVGEDGAVYVSDRNAGEVKLLRDTDADGVSDQMNVVATIQGAHGLAIHEGKLYIVAVQKIYSADIQQDGTLAEPQMLTDSLPTGGQHPNRTIAFGPDGQMFVTVGSTCNSCDETSPLSATILRGTQNASNLKVFASGLRNTIGFDWHPETGELWGMDHGIDWLGDNEQKEELNRIVEGADYGWPYIYGEGNYNPGDRPPGDTTYEQYLDKTTLPVLTYTAHAAPMGMLFYTGDQFPDEYQNDAFVVFRGSWNRSKPVGYKVARLNFENGEPTTFEDFMTDFLTADKTAHFGRIAGIAMLTDGSLLVSDDTNGVIYRIAYNN